MCAVLSQSISQSELNSERERERECKLQGTSSVLLRGSQKYVSSIGLHVPGQLITHTYIVTNNTAGQKMDKLTSKTDRERAHMKHRHVHAYKE